MQRGIKAGQQALTRPLERNQPASGTQFQRQKGQHGNETVGYPVSDAIHLTPKKNFYYEGKLKFYTCDSGTVGMR
jgi:hypothetical protein